MSVPPCQPLINVSHRREEDAAIVTVHTGHRYNVMSKQSGDAVLVSGPTALSMESAVATAMDSPPGAAPAAAAALRRRRGGRRTSENGGRRGDAC